MQYPKNHWPGVASDTFSLTTFIKMYGKFGGELKNDYWFFLRDLYDHDYFQAVETILIKLFYGNLNYLCFPITKTHHSGFLYKDA